MFSQESATFRVALTIAGRSVCDSGFLPGIFAASGIAFDEYIVVAVDVVAGLRSRGNERSVVGFTIRLETQRKKLCRRFLRHVISSVVCRC
jgi:hypothetical protein